MKTIERELSEVDSSQTELGAEQSGKIEILHAMNVVSFPFSIIDSI